MTPSTHDTTENKQIVQSFFDDLAKGDGRPFIEAMADDFSWIIPGRATWSGEWRGKQAVREQLLRPLLARFATTYTNRAVRLIAEGDHVVVECRGDVMTKTGKRYDNTYCYVFTLREGKLTELVEYMDTELAADALGAP